MTAGRVIGALCGKIAPGRTRIARPGLDFVIAQGTEGGGHTGEIGSSIVLWPQIIDGRRRRLPVLAAGGIATGAPGRRGPRDGCRRHAWTGSIWLTVEEAEAQPAQIDSYLNASSLDTVRSRSWTGKPCRMLKNDWTEAWGADDTPDPLGMPLQGMVVSEAMTRVHRYGTAAQKVAFNPVGQTVGMMNEMKSTRETIMEIVEQYLDSVERLEKLQANV